MQYLRYTIQLGDTLQSIAQAFGVPMNDLLAANPQIFTQPMFCAGTVLLVPQMNTTPSYPQPTPTPMPTPTPAPTPLPAPIPTTPGTGNGTGTGSGAASLKAQVIQLVNQERENRGLDPLTVNDTLTSIARTKSEDMVANNYFSHNSPTYGSPFDMLSQFGVSYSTAGENIASGQTTAASVMDTWMNSPGHAANILNDAYTEIGVGVSYNNGRPIWTQMFLRP
jgi:uncharacterized YkwD family protein